MLVDHDTHSVSPMPGYFVNYIRRYCSAPPFSILFSSEMRDSMKSKRVSRGEGEEEEEEDEEGGGKGPAAATTAADSSALAMVTLFFGRLFLPYRFSPMGVSFPAEYTLSQTWKQTLFYFIFLCDRSCVLA